MAVNAADGSSRDLTEADIRWVEPDRGFELKIPHWKSEQAYGNGLHTPQTSDVSELGR